MKKANYLDSRTTSERQKDSKLKAETTFAKIMPKKEKCKHEWYGKRYCYKCRTIEMWGKLTGDTARDFKKKIMSK